MKQVSSSIHGTDKEIASYLGISEKTFKKYINLGICAGIIRKFRNGYHCSNFRLSINVLFPDRRITKHVRFTDKSLNFQQLVERIPKEILLNNFKQQKYKISRKLSLRNTLTSKYSPGFSSKRIKRIYKEFQNNEQALIVGFKDQIVTGSRHASKLIGLSPSKTNKVINDLVNDGIIERHIIKEKICQSNNPLIIEGMKQSNFGVIYSSKRGCYRTVGSVIVLNSIIGL